MRVGVKFQTLWAGRVGCWSLQSVWVQGSSFPLLESMPHQCGRHELGARTRWSASCMWWKKDDAKFWTQIFSIHFVLMPSTSSRSRTKVLLLWSSSCTYCIAYCSTFWRPSRHFLSTDSCWRLLKMIELANQKSAEQCWKCLHKCDEGYWSSCRLSAWLGAVFPTVNKSADCERFWFCTRTGLASRKTNHWGTQALVSQRMTIQLAKRISDRPIADRRGAISKKNSRMCSMPCFTVVHVTRHCSELSPGPSRFSP